MNNSWIFWPLKSNFMIVALTCRLPVILMIMLLKVKQWTSSALTFWDIDQDKLKARWLPKILLIFPLVRVMLLAAAVGTCECVLGFSNTDSKEWSLTERIYPISLFWLLFEQCLNTIRAFPFLFCSPEFKGWVGGQDMQLRCLLTGIDHSMSCDKVLKQQMLKERKKGQFGYSGVQNKFCGHWSTAF